MISPPLTNPATYTVICGWHAPADTCDPPHLMSVVISHCGDPQEAADNACLYLIWKHQGAAEPWLVLAGQPSIFVPSAGIFDSEEYEESISFAGRVIEERDLS